MLYIVCNAVECTYMLPVYIRHIMIIFYIKVILCAYEHIFLVVRYRFISFNQL